MKTTLSQHQDRGGLSSPRKAPDGTTIFSGVAAKIHDAQHPLRYEDGPEFRKADQVQSIATQIIGKPITVDHAGGPVGEVIAARVDGGLVVVDFKINLPPKEARALLREKPELSLEYTTRLDQNRYQIDIQVQALSVVPLGRCGNSCSTKLDASCCSACVSKGRELNADDDPLAREPAPLDGDEEKEDDLDDDEDGTCDPDDPDYDSDLCDDDGEDEANTDHADSAMSEAAATARLRARTASAWRTSSAVTPKTKSARDSAKPPLTETAAAKALARRTASAWRGQK